VTARVPLAPPVPYWASVSGIGTGRARISLRSISQNAIRQIWGASGSASLYNGLQPSLQNFHRE
jgi:hypothetical protein